MKASGADSMPWATHYITNVEIDLDAERERLRDGRVVGLVGACVAPFFGESVTTLPPWHHLEASVDGVSVTLAAGGACANATPPVVLRGTESVPEGSPVETLCSVSTSGTTSPARCSASA